MADEPVETDRFTYIAALPVDYLARWTWRYLELHRRLPSPPIDTARDPDLWRHAPDPEDPVDSHRHLVGPARPDDIRDPWWREQVGGWLLGVRDIICLARRRRLINKGLTTANLAALAPFIAPSFGVHIPPGEHLDPALTTAGVFILKLGLDEICAGYRTPRRSKAQDETKQEEPAKAATRTRKPRAKKEPPIEQ